MYLQEKLTDHSIPHQMVPCRHTGSSLRSSTFLLSHTSVPCVHSSLEMKNMYSIFKDKPKCINNLKCNIV